MITWVLIVSYWAGNATYQYAIPNIESYEECVKTSTQVPKPPGTGKFETTCIEVKSAKPIKEDLKSVCPKSAARVCS